MSERIADAENYYVVRANALEENVNFYRVVKGTTPADQKGHREGVIWRVAHDRL